MRLHKDIDLIIHAVKGLEGIIEIDFRLGLFLELLPQGFILQNKH